MEYLYTLVYITQCIIIWGWSVAYWDNSFSLLKIQREDYILSLLYTLVMSILPILGLLIALIQNNGAKYGWQVWGRK